MGQSSKEARRRLYGLAAPQYGFFTARDALQAGYKDNVHPYHVRNGDWIRVARGIYRLAQFPEVLRAELMVAALWSRDRKGTTQGVFSHMTALEIRGLVAPEEGAVHMTVPGKFRRNSQPPKGVILHKNGLSQKHVEEVHGLRVTSVMKTVADLQECGIGQDFFDEVGADLTAREPPGLLRGPLPAVTLGARRRTAKPAGRGTQRKRRQATVRPAVRAARGSEWGGARAW